MGAARVSLGAWTAGIECVAITTGRPVGMLIGRGYGSNGGGDARMSLAEWRGWATGNAAACCCASLVFMKRMSSGGVVNMPDAKGVPEEVEEVEEEAIDVIETVDAIDVADEVDEMPLRTGKKSPGLPIEGRADADIPAASVDSGGPTDASVGPARARLAAGGCT